MFHRWLYGHKKKPGIIGYDGIGNVWGCLTCEGGKDVKTQ